MLADGIESNYVGDCIGIIPDIMLQPWDHCLLVDYHFPPIGLEAARFRTGVGGSHHGLVAEDIHGGLAVKKDHITE